MGGVWGGEPHSDLLECGSPSKISITITSGTFCTKYSLGANYIMLLKILFP